MVRTIAAQDFIRFIEEQTTWQKFKDYTDLRQQAFKLLVEHILNRSYYYTLRSGEVDKLTTWLEELNKSKKRTSTITWWNWRKQRNPIIRTIPSL